MAYARFDGGCEWYIFWQSTKADEAQAAPSTSNSRNEQVLAIWHSSYRFLEPYFTYSDVREMLASVDLSRIPGFDEGSRTLLLECMTEFVQDVDNDYVA